MIENGIYFGCDMLEFSFDGIRKNFNFGVELNVGLNDTNTNQAYFELYGHIFTFRDTFSKGGFPLKIFTTSIDNIPIDLFAFRYSKKIFGGTSESKDIVIFYSSMFILANMGKLNFKIEDFYNTYFSKYGLLNRLDICLDVPYTIKYLQETIFSKTSFFSEIGHDKLYPQFSQTYYIKNPQSSENRNYVIRIYDKVLDTFKKGKHFLYPHLQHDKNIRRIELELRPKDCFKYQNINIADIITNKNNILQTIFGTYINKNIGDIELHIDYTKIKTKMQEYYKPFNLQEFYLTEKHIPKDYLLRAKGYITKIKNIAGFTGLFDVILGVVRFKDPNGELNIENIKYKDLENLLIDYIQYLQCLGLSKRRIITILSNVIKKLK